jgi:hypothetical protein
MEQNHSVTLLGGMKKIKELKQKYDKRNGNGSHTISQKDDFGRKKPR